MSRSLPFPGILRAIVMSSAAMLSKRPGLGKEDAYTRPALNSNVSPFRGTAKAPLILLTAMSPSRARSEQRRKHHSCSESAVMEKGGPGPNRANCR